MGKTENPSINSQAMYASSQAAPKPKPWSVVDACDTWRHVQGMEEVMRQYSDPKKDADKMANPTKRVVNLTSSSVYIFIAIPLAAELGTTRIFPKVQKTPHPSASNQPSATQAVALQPPAGHPCVSENGGYPLVN